MERIILATASRYRIEAFKFLGIDFISEASNVDEYAPDRPKNPEELVLFLAKLKALTVAKNHSEGFVMGFDSIGVFGKTILEKPCSRKEAFDRLTSLSDKEFSFITGVYIIDVSTGKTVKDLVETKAHLRNLFPSEINHYLDQDKNYNTYALGFDPLGHYSSTFISRIEGSYNNILRGIPLESIIGLLKKSGYKVK